MSTPSGKFEFKSNHKKVSNKRGVPSLLTQTLKHIDHKTLPEPLQRHVVHKKAKDIRKTTKREARHQNRQANIALAKKVTENYERGASEAAALPKFSFTSKK